MTALKTLFLAGALIVGAGSLAAAQGAATGGTGGSAAAGGTSASTLGLGATSGGSSSLGTGGSAAGGTRDTSSSRVNGNGNGMSKARAQDKGTWSDSKTHTRIHKGEVISRTKSMSHEPGGPPTKSTTGINTGK